jgi:hypothetical protein
MLKTIGSPSSKPCHRLESVRLVSLLRKGTWPEDANKLRLDRIAFLIETAQGSYVWDCCAFLSGALVEQLLGLKTPLKGIIISHPHVRIGSRKKGGPC